MTKINCPICRKETTWQNNVYRPFCSDRCRLIDLGQWASEGYKIPVTNNSDQELDELPQSTDSNDNNN